MTSPLKGFSPAPSPSKIPYYPRTEYWAVLWLEEAAKVCRTQSDAWRWIDALLAPEAVEVCRCVRDLLPFYFLDDPSEAAP